MIIALYGRSSSGKTTIAKALAPHLGNCQIRHCGEIVKERARQLSVSLGDLPYEEHLKIDAETVGVANTHSGKIIIEGRYLHWVLSQIQAGVRLVELDCSEAVRIERWAVRSKGGISRSGLAGMDAAEQDFTVKMFGRSVPLQSGLKIDTTSNEINACVQQILNWLSIR
ncbi:hypothetical protein DW355_02485 [Hylemonella gracilis]|uniref:AAA family ATPase n=1 Tax=Hylemonella gracilis TaxID=80880 RepID=A0A4V1A1U7_9BURK|nr:AAA family ATPase [Hylemonella gracilis]QBK03789.1 hypothetical protein DW355_02485 [Hylemonella gracilis]